MCVRDVVPPLRDGAARCKDEVEIPLAFRQSRPFTFVHHFAGAHAFGIGEAVVAEASRMGLTASHISVDRDKDGANLLDPEPYDSHWQLASQGKVDGFHAGFPCGSFSPVRLRPAPGMPGPVRDPEHIYGRPDNSPAQQREADIGTLGAIRSVRLAEVVRAAAVLRGAEPVATVEQPMPQARAEATTAFLLDEVAAWLAVPGGYTAQFSVCRFGRTPGGLLVGKRLWFTGVLLGLSSLDGICECLEPHDSLHTPAQVKESGSYPAKLCVAYAQLVVQAWLSTLRAEWLASKCSVPSPVMIRTHSHQLVRQLAPKRPAWASLDSAKPTRPSLKARREVENESCIGGLRNPHSAVAKNPGLRRVGRTARAAFSSFADLHPEALEIGHRAGDRSYPGPPSELISAFRAHLRTALEAPAEATAGWSWGAPSPIQGHLFQSWLDQAGDPEKHISEWVYEGVPLGIEQDIPSCGIFPTAEHGEPERDLVGVVEAAQAGFFNYASFHEFDADARIELDRVLQAQFAVSLSSTEVLERFPDGSVARMAIIVKTKEDGSVKRRIIVDLKRSGANSRARIPERPVLPRITDAIGSALAVMRAHHSAHSAPSDTSGELLSADFSDAFHHFRVHPRELQHCLVRDLRPDVFLLWVCMCFGLKAAPLIWCRLAAALARILQGMLEPSEGKLQLYIDDPLWFLVGSLHHRTFLKSMLLLTIAALGKKLAWHKMSCGTAVEWIGVALSCDWQHQFMTARLPDRFVTDLRGELLSLSGQSMVGIRRLRTVTGRLSWAAGVLPRMRWAVSILYAVLASFERDVLSGAEEARRLRRSDQRSKETLLPTKRLGLALRWLISLFQGLTGAVERSVPATPPRLEWTIVVDASPWGLGAFLAHARLGRVLAYVSSPLDSLDCASLGLTIGECTAQGIAETLAVLVAVRTWGAVFAGRPVRLGLRSDSTTALATARRLASSSPALNFLGAELALDLECLGAADLVGTHLPGAWNDAADWLSRRAQPGVAASPLPAELSGAKELAPKRRAASWYRLPTFGADPQLWGSATAAAAGAAGFAETDV